MPSMAGWWRAKGSKSRGAAPRSRPTPLSRTKKWGSGVSPKPNSTRDSARGRLYLRAFSSRFLSTARVAREIPGFPGDPLDDAAGVVRERPGGVGEQQVGVAGDRPDRRPRLVGDRMAEGLEVPACAGDGVRLPRETRFRLPGLGAVEAHAPERGRSAAGRAAGTGPQDDPERPLVPPVVAGDAVEAGLLEPSFAKVLDGEAQRVEAAARDGGRVGFAGEAGPEGREIHRAVAEGVLPRARPGGLQREGEPVGVGARGGGGAGSFVAGVRKRASVSHATMISVNLIAA
jgi:hypothetical protein